MNPLFIVVLIVLALLGAYLLIAQLGAVQIATGAANSAAANYTILAIKVLMVVMVLYGIYYVLDVIKTSSRERKERERLTQERIARENRRI